MASVLPTQATMTEAGKGVLLGHQHAFAYTAVNGWVLDNQSGANQGLHMVFYPKQQTWKNSPVLMYGRAMPLSKVPSIKDHVDFTVNDFRTHGNPNYKATYQGTIELNNDKQAQIYYFSGDQWGNYEAAAYVKEKHTINYLVFNARTKQAFDKNIPAFNNMVRTYQNLYSAPDSVNPKKITQLTNKSEQQLKTKAAKTYEFKAAKAISPHMSNSFQTCSAHLPKNQKKQFKYYAVVAENGSVKESIVNPSSLLSNCFKGMMRDAKYPTHQFGQFIFILNMDIKP